MHGYADDGAVAFEDVFDVVFGEHESVEVADEYPCVHCWRVIRVRHVTDFAHIQSTWLASQFMFLLSFI